ncbi:MAG: spore photoproduct lyase family protein, partial [Gammaproteobacteria bacterium]
RQQNFRVQKARPALILAQKSALRLHPVPAGQHLGADHNYYFSHLLNCPFDCRYCFLQGMFSSANYVLFVNYEAFLEDIHALSGNSDGLVHIFSGYDCDSLALEPLTGFAEFFVSAFSRIDNAVLELRTKSTQVRSLLAQTAHDHSVVAMSIAPAGVITRFEHGTPGLEERLGALKRLQQQGWPIGLRFDPLIVFAGCEVVYRDFFNHVFATLDAAGIHSVTLGGLRLPREFAKRMVKLYPDEALFAAAFDDNDGVRTASGTSALLRTALDAVSRHVPTGRIFVQQSMDGSGTSLA